MRFRHVLPILALTLAGCEQLGLDDSAKVAAQREADGKAIGSACRQSGRALEDCYTLYSKASKAAIFAGWQAMDAYMRENKIPEVVPDTVEPPGGKKAAEEPKPEAGGEEKAPPPAAEKKPAKTGDATPPVAKGRRMA